MRKLVFVPIALVAAGIGIIAGVSYTQGDRNDGGNERILASNTAKVKKQGIRFFKGSWKEAKQRAEAAKAPIFVDAYATWCAPCKMMEKRVFTQQKVGRFYNKHFISFQYNMEEGKGVKFRKRHNVSAYPTLLFFNSKGEVVHRRRGAMGPDGLVQAGRKAMDQISTAQ